MAQILGLNGSPRKRGNTSILVAEVLRGAAEAGATTEAVSLGGLNIRECDGCHVCWSGRECPKADDMLDLYRRIGAADVIVFGTPVYWYGPTALMKALIDRCVYFNCPENRPLVRGTAAALVIPFEEDDPAMADLTVAMFAKSLEYLEMRLVGQVLAPGVGPAGAVRAKAAVMGKAFELGRRLAEGG